MNLSNDPLTADHGSLDLFAEESIDSLAAEELPLGAAHGSFSTVFSLSTIGACIATLGSFSCIG